MTHSTCCKAEVHMVNYRGADKRNYTNLICTKCHSFCTFELEEEKDIPTPTPPPVPSETEKEIRNKIGDIIKDRYYPNYKIAFDIDVAKLTALITHHTSVQKKEEKKQLISKISYWIERDAPHVTVELDDHVSPVKYEEAITVKDLIKYLSSYEKE